MKNDFAKKNLVFLLLELFIFFSCSAQIPKSNDLSRMNLKGNVKTLVEVDNTGYETKSEFNEQGNLISSISFKLNDPNKILNKIIYQYNSKGLLIQNESSSMLKEKWLYTYNSKGLLIQRESYVRGALSWKTLYTYNDDGKEIEQDHYSSKNELTSKTTTKYDIRGLKVEEKQTGGGDPSCSRTEYSYDENNNNVNSISYNCDNKIYSIQLHRFNEKSILEEDSWQFGLTIDNKSYIYGSLKYSDFDSHNNWKRSERIDYINSNYPITKDITIKERTLTYY
jgi:hypothetical protein